MKKAMKKGFLAIALVFTLVLSMVPALAATDSGAFTDVASDVWYAKAVAYCVENGLMVGTSDTAFSPSAELSRAMIATILHRATGSPAVTGTTTFTDVQSGQWYTDAVTWANQTGIVSGYGNNIFGTNDPVTREQLVTILWRYKNSPEPSKTAAYADAAKVSSWAANAVSWGRTNGMINVKSGNTFAPQDKATRAETAYMFKQMLAPASPAPFDLAKGTVVLNNGVEMPVLGLGTYRLSAEETEISVAAALTSGYKLIDTAAAYGNEEAVGRGIKKSGVAREDVFITTKLWPASYGNAAAAIDDALEKLGVEYIDLLLLHQPWQDYIGAYQAMEDAVRAGKVRAIGVSNFYQSSFDAIMAVATIPPAVLQNERNPYFQQAEMMEHIAPFGTIMMDWFPLGGRGDNVVPTERQKSLFEDEIILEIAEAHGKTAPQIILRWHIQSGGIAIPGSRNPDHIKENISIFDFELTEAEMQMIAGLETDIPSFDFRDTTEQPDFETFEPPVGE